jgi:hypothetical protein
MITEEDAKLWYCNESELIEMAGRQGLGRLRRGIEKGVLIAIVGGYDSPKKEHFSDTTYTRRELEKYIWANIEKARSQLPGCDGKCTTYKCSDGRHGLCFIPNEAVVQ